ncbi:hypothetical protein EVAR_10694_1 [Eumeta japonica]|uniref:Uncharacterized protein n=1 Tax=Eumeta variegata TaxID=151549 RepID=A0A4C1U8D4_EUMVA|nr:hypothetical protein EVAR_10694_1 [Eumeta japonica]
MDSVFFQTSLFSRALQGDGWLATVSDAPLPLHFIGGASVAHVSCIHFNWGGVAMHLICICIGFASVDLPHPRFSGCRCGTEDLLLPHARASSRRGHDPDGSSGNGPYLMDPLLTSCRSPVADPHAGARGHCAGAAGRWRGSGVSCSTREAQLRLDTQPTAGGRTLVDADRIKAARIGDPRWRRSDRARLPTADQAIHASDGSSQGSTCQRAVSFNLFFSL